VSCRAHTDGLIYKRGRNSKYDGTAKVGGVTDLRKKLWLQFPAPTVGAFWTASGVLVSGCASQGKLFFADPTRTPEAPWHADEAQNQSVTRPAEVPLRRPTPEEVQRDVSEIERQIYEARKRLLSA
jgi:hypothetical protein